MSKQKPKKPEPEVVETPDPADTESRYTAHLLVSVELKQRLELIRLRINQARKRKGLRALPHGWFVERGMRDWLELVEAATTLGPDGEPLEE